MLLVFCWYFFPLFFSLAENLVLWLRYNIKQITTKAATTRKHREKKENVSGFVWFSMKFLHKLLCIMMHTKDTAIIWLNNAILYYVKLIHTSHDHMQTWAIIFAFTFIVKLFCYYFFSLSMLLYLFDEKMSKIDGDHYKTALPCRGGTRQIAHGTWKRPPFSLKT